MNEFKQLYIAALDFACSEPDMPSHKEVEDAFDNALMVAYKALVDSGESVPSPE